MELHPADRTLSPPALWWPPPAPPPTPRRACAPPLLAGPQLTIDHDER